MRPVGWMAPAFQVSAAAAGWNSGGPKDVGNPVPGPKSGGSVKVRKVNKLDAVDDVSK